MKLNRCCGFMLLRVSVVDTEIRVVGSGGSLIGVLFLSSVVDFCGFIVLGVLVRTLGSLVSHICFRMVGVVLLLGLLLNLRFLLLLLSMVVFTGVFCMIILGLRAGLLAFRWMLLLINVFLVPIRIKMVR